MSLEPLSEWNSWLYTEDPRERCHSVSTVGGHTRRSEAPATCGRGPQQKLTKLPSGLRLPVFKTMRNKILLFITHTVYSSLLQEA